MAFRNSKLHEGWLFDGGISSICGHRPISLDHYHRCNYNLNTYMNSGQPLKSDDFHILLALADGPCHGYGIMKEVEAESGGGVRLEIGSLYRLLGRLLAEGLIEEADSDERRRYYRLTRLGRRALKSEAERLSGLVELVRSRKLLPGADT
jgi:DNA-binding PadR family transcriptional regulator